MKRGLAFHDRRGRYPLPLNGLAEADALAILAAKQILSPLGPATREA